MRQQPSSDDALDTPASLAPIEDVYTLVYDAEVSGGVQAHGVFEHIASLMDDITGHLEALYSLEPDDEPVTITISGGGADSVTLTIKRVMMDAGEFDNLDEFGGY